MQTSTMEKDGVQLAAPGRFARLRSRAAGRMAYVAAGVIALVAGGMTPAMAQTTTTDPLNGGGDGIFTTLTDYLTTSLVGKVFALAVVSIAIGLVLRWVRKAVHA